MLATKNVDSLMLDLASDDRQRRQQARESLVALGKPAVALLLEALAASSPIVRWEAVKALGEIGDPAAIPALVKALEDETIDVRWRAAESLIVFKRDGLASLLQALVQRADSAWLREGAQHVLRSLTADEDLEDLVTPVLTALEEIEPKMTGPVAANRALKILQAQ